MGMDLILLGLPPEQLHIRGRPAVIIGKVGQSHLVVLSLFKQLKTDIGQEIIAFVIRFPNRLGAERKQLLFRVLFHTYGPYGLQCQLLHLFFLPPQPHTVDIPLAHIQIAQLVKQTLALIGNGIGIVSSVPRLPTGPSWNTKTPALRLPCRGLSG